MKIKRLLAVLMIIAATIIAWLFMPRARLVVNHTQTPYAAAAGPLREALENGVSEVEFENLVKQHPDWVSHRSGLGGVFSWPVLADCALLQRTNYVRILLANGADAEEAIKSLEEVGADEAIGLIRQVRSEHVSELVP